MKRDVLVHFETGCLSELQLAMLHDPRSAADIYASYGLVDADDADRLGIPCPPDLRRDALDALAKVFALHVHPTLIVIDVVYALLHGAGLGTDADEDVAVAKTVDLWPCTDATNDSGALDLRLRVSFAYDHVRARDLLLEKHKSLNVTPPDCEDPTHAFVDGDALSDIQDAGGLLRPVFHWGADEGDVHGPRCQDERFLRIFERVLSYDRYVDLDDEPDWCGAPCTDFIGGAHGPRLHLEALRRHDK